MAFRPARDRPEAPAGLHCKGIAVARKVKVGVVGIGTVAELFYLDAIVAHGARAELTALADVAPGRARAAAEKWGARAAFEDLDEMLARTDVEAVLVLTRHTQHYEHAKKVLEAGRHLGIEKPIAHTFEKATEIVELAERRGLKLAAAPAMVFEPVSQRAKELLLDGAIGQISFVRTQMIANPADRETEWRRLDPVIARLETPPTDQTWMFDAAEGGPLFDLTTYQLIEPTSLLGPIQRVGALTGIAVRERVALSGPTKGQAFTATAPDNNAMLFDWGDDRLGMAYSGYLPPSFRGPHTEYYGDEGALAINGGMGADSVELYRLDGDRAPTWKPVGQPHDGWGIVPRAGAITHLVDCILDDTELQMSARQALHIIEVLELVPKSSTSGRFLETTSTF